MYVDKFPQWIDNIEYEDYIDNQLQQIMYFFVLHSPVPGLSGMHISLNDYGWSKPWSKPFYLNRQLKDAASEYKLLYSADTYEHLDVAIKKSGTARSFPNSLDAETVVIYDCKKNQFMSTFFHIRNALAHGRFAIKNNSAGQRVLLMEDVAPNNKKNGSKLSARIILRVDTLISWIEIIRSGEREYNVSKVTIE